MALDVSTLPRHVAQLKSAVEDLQTVVNGDPDRDVAGLRKRVTDVERLTRELAEARKEEQIRWEGFQKGATIILSLTSVGSIGSLLINVLPLLKGLHF